MKHYQVDSEAALVIPTGGDPARAGVTEAAVMARLLAEAGVAAARIVQEPRARTTAENAIYVLQLVAARLEARAVNGPSRSFTLPGKGSYNTMSFSLLNVPISAYTIKNLCMKTLVKFR